MKQFNAVLPPLSPLERGGDVAAISKKVSTGCVTLLFCLFFSCLTYAQTYTGIAAKAHQYIDSLASNTFKGRGYTSGGNAKAAVYIRNTFNQILQQDSVYTKTQPFSFPVNTFSGRLEVQCDKKTLTPGKAFILQPFTQHVDGTFDVKYVNIKKAWNAKTGELKIKLKPNQWLCYKAGDVPDKLKKGLLEKMIKENFFGATGVIEITGEKLTMDVWQEALPVTYLVVRSDSLNFIPKKIHIVLDEGVVTANTQNIFTEVPGKVYPDSFLVLTAHYDHLGELGNKTYFPGANDNASGISMLLTLAQTIKESPMKYSVVFIAFSGEEAGLLGSKYFVEHPLIDLKKIKFLINLDIVGTGEEGIKVVNGAVDTAHYNLLKRLNDQNQLLKSVQPRGKASNSDHYFFTEAGVPAFFIYTMGGISAYHDVYDISATLPLTKYNELYKLLLLYLKSF